LKGQHLDQEMRKKEESHHEFLLKQSQENLDHAQNSLSTQVRQSNDLNFQLQAKNRD